MKTTYCAICAEKKIFREAVHLHHLIPGNGRRKKADKYGLVIPLCSSCHEEIHGSTEIILSKYLGQMMFERDRIEEGMTMPQAIWEFMREFGESYLWD